MISSIYAKRVSIREANGRYPSNEIFGWSTAYGPSDLLRLNQRLLTKFQEQSHEIEFQNSRLMRLAAGAFLVACSEPPEIAVKAAKRPDVAPYMGADNGFMTKG